MGFTLTNADLYVFSHKDGAIIDLYVDDLIILILRGRLRIMADIKNKLSSHFKIKQLNTIK